MKPPSSGVIRIVEGKLLQFEEKPLKKVDFTKAPK
jgi:hypothetical protein